MQPNKTSIGLYEKITLFGNNAPNREIIAKIDTGATRSSIDVKLAAGLKLGPVLTSRMIKCAQGSTLRPIVEGEIIIAGKRLNVHFTIANRSKMKYPLLIGQDVLKEGEFLIDPSKI